MSQSLRSYAVFFSHCLCGCVRTLPAQLMKTRGVCEFESVVEGDIRQRLTAEVPADIDRSRVHFMQVTI